MSDRTTGATDAQLASAIRRLARSGPIYGTGDICQNSRWWIERMAALIAPPDQRIVSRKFVEASRRIAKDFADLVADHNGFDYAQSYLNHIHENLEIIDEVPS